MGAALNIKDPEVHELATELARRTRQSLTVAVKASLRASLASQRAGTADEQGLVDRIMRIAERVAALPVLDSRTSDEIPGYTEAGHFD